MKTEHCMRCGTEALEKQITKIVFGNEYALICQTCVKKLAYEMLGKAWALEHADEEDKE